MCKAHNEHYMEQRQWPHQAVLNKIWVHICAYIQKEWRRLLEMVKLKVVSIKAVETWMCDYFGKDTRIFRVDGGKLEVTMSILFVP